MTTITALLLVALVPRTVAYTQQRLAPRPFGMTTHEDHLYRSPSYNAYPPASSSMYEVMEEPVAWPMGSPSRYDSPLPPPPPAPYYYQDDFPYNRERVSWNENRYETSRMVDDFAYGPYDRPNDTFLRGIGREPYPVATERVMDPYYAPPTTMPIERYVGVPPDVPLGDDDYYYPSHRDRAYYGMSEEVMEPIMTAMSPGRTDVVASSYAYRGHPYDPILDFQQYPMQYSYHDDNDIIINDADYLSPPSVPPGHDYYDYDDHYGYDGYATPPPPVTETVTNPAVPLSPPPPPPSYYNERGTRGNSMYADNGVTVPPRFESGYNNHGVEDGFRY